MEPKAPSLVVAAWISFTSYANVYTFLSLMDVCFGVYAERVLTIPTSRFTSLIVISVWAFIIWLLLKMFHVRERSFDHEMVNKYKESGCRDWWIFTYFLGSMVAMVWVGWIAGTQHRGGH